MKKLTTQIITFLIMFFLATGFITPTVYAGESTDTTVQSVIEKLQQIDTLEQMQNNRSSYKVNYPHYDIDTTDTSIITDHQKARTGYETYVKDMFAKRAEAQQAYDALTESQKAQINSELVEKLSNDLPTVFKYEAYSVTPPTDEYTFEAVEGGTGLGYEVSNHMVYRQIPQTFILIDTSNDETTWRPSGKYVYGESNYNVTYCCDVETGIEYGSHYKRINLEDSNYYGPSAAKHIRAILQNSYPYVSVEEMKNNLKTGGLNEDFVDTLTRADLIAAIQMAIWTYANAGDNNEGNIEYFASINVPKNDGIYFHPLHDYTNECWDWFPGKQQRSYDARAAYRVNTLAYYLCNLEGVAPEENQIIITDVKVTRADLLPDSNDIYHVGMYIYLNNSGNAEDNLTVTVTSSHKEDETVVQTSQNSQKVNGNSKLEMYVKAKPNDTIKVVVQGTQNPAKGVYFYEPQGGRKASQCLVGVAEGETHVYAEETFEFIENSAKKGLRIYKTENSTGLPLSDITFTIYKVIPANGDNLNETPTKEEIEKYSTEENKVNSVTTDVTGYASIALDNGTYMIVEEHNTEKIKKPVDPIYITIPMNETKENEDGTTTTETLDIVSIYPKNETVTPPEGPPVIPPFLDNVVGKFEIVKYDEVDNTKLAGAEFQVYREATSEDTDTEIILCNGTEHTVVPVKVNNDKLVLTTNNEGKAVSPELTCGTYYLKETKAPDGYKLLDEAVPITVVSKEMNTTTIEIPNQRGNILPETGGMGTTKFFLIGSIIMISASILLFTRKRVMMHSKF